MVENSASETDTDVGAIAPFELPKPHVAWAFLCVEMFVWVILVDPEATQITEMRAAFEADHMIAAHRFLATRVTCRARGRVHCHIFFRSKLLFGQLVLLTRKAREEFAVPAGLTYFAERKGAVFANREAFLRRRHGVLVGVRIVFLRPRSLAFYVGFFVRFLRRRPSFLGACGALTPLARAVDGGSIRFQFFLAFEHYISLDSFLIQRYLKKLTRF